MFEALHKLYETDSIAMLHANTICVELLKLDVIKEDSYQKITACKIIKNKMKFITGAGPGGGSFNGNTVKWL